MRVARKAVFVRAHQHGVDVTQQNQIADQTCHAEVNVPRLLGGQRLVKGCQARVWEHVDTTISTAPDPEDGAVQLALRHCRIAPEWTARDAVNHRAKVILDGLKTYEEWGSLSGSTCQVLMRAACVVAKTVRQAELPSNVACHGDLKSVNIMNSLHGIYLVGRDSAAPVGAAWDVAFQRAVCETACGHS
jgi:thiamine kinase-like enzyme